MARTTHVYTIDHVATLIGENPRMLLNFTQQRSKGIGNDHDLVGRYFCEQPSVVVADALFTHPQAIEAGRLATTRAFILEKGTLGFSCRVHWRAFPPDDLFRPLKSGIECATPGNPGGWPSGCTGGPRVAAGAGSRNSSPGATRRAMPPDGSRWRPSRR
jgi:hypothetical protein